MVKSKTPWPPNSPGLNPLDFFWGYTMNHVFRVKPNSMEDLKSVVNDFAHAMDPDLVKKVCRSARSRFEKMRTQLGGHFQQL